MSSWKLLVQLRNFSKQELNPINITKPVIKIGKLDTKTIEVLEQKGIYFDGQAFIKSGENADKLKISGTDLVWYTRDAIRKIKSYKSIIYSDAERDKIFNLLLNANIIDVEINKQHNREIKELKDAKKRELKLKEIKKLKKLIEK